MLDKAINILSLSVPMSAAAGIIVVMAAPDAMFQRLLSIAVVVTYAFFFAQLTCIVFAVVRKG